MNPDPEKPIILPIDAPTPNPGPVAANDVQVDDVPPAAIGPKPPTDAGSVPATVPAVAVAPVEVVNPAIDLAPTPAAPAGAAVVALPSNAVANAIGPATQARIHSHWTGYIGLLVAALSFLVPVLTLLTNPAWVNDLLFGVSDVRIEHWHQLQVTLVVATATGIIGAIGANVGKGLLSGNRIAGPPQ